MSEAAEQAPKKTYRGNCHCGAFIFEVTVPEIKSVSGCNCSICTKKGYLLIFPGDGDFKVVKDEGKLTEYTSSGKYIHKFCSNCGTAVLVHTAVNARTIQDLNIWSLETTWHDAAKLDPQYDPPKYTGPEPASIIDGKTYYGSCHCGDVKMAVKVAGDLEGGTYPDDIVECNCSICQRGSFIWIYPKKDQVAIEGGENLSEYVFGTSLCRKAFCKRCGVYLTNDNVPMTEEVISALPPPVQEWARRKVLPVTLRALNHVDLGGKVKEQAKRMPGWSVIQPMYVNP
ncbi:putative glutathione-dependent formaldehyde-activating gfa protein [Diplogelasinospora grovesii]|uniref:Glutathione-dependent formaldehyde-activating gfa protein n=1 Tax=Diplogelasinospora grovesii TaxID=303347 RepID=A0AAN6NHM0_9PEZI|nr:putative glutathione-dependent formaldehyde-activating gfa protein [Diplogelasinospora grovesii]